MAAVLDALVPYVKQMVKDMAEEELRMLLGVTSGIKKLEDNVGHLERYAADAEKRRIDNPTVKWWVSKVKGALYEATDILELCHLHAEERQQLGAEDCWTIIEEKAPGFLQPLLFCLRNPGFAHDLGSRLKRLNASFDEIRKEMVGVILNPFFSCPVQSPPSEATPPSRKTTSLLDHSTVVGDVIERNTKVLVQELLADEPAIKVVSIVGAGGIGKTTLARKIFNDKDIKVEFISKIWLSITDSYDEEKLLSSAITQAGGGINPRGDKQVLTRYLADTLSATGKFLLVMDDVWCLRPWDDVLQSPIKAACQTTCQTTVRVIITTRKEDLVLHMGVAYRQHHVKPLSDEDAWSLLKQQLPQDVDGENVDRLEHIGMGIVRKCDGLPLAIKVVGGLLRKKKVTQRDWKSVLDEPLWSAYKTHHELNSALRLSYEDLSTPLKQCFMYYSLFPKGLTMINNHVVGMWMSEGFLPVDPSDNRTRKEDIGLSYYKDLIERNLIEPDREIAGDGSVSKMHDVIRSFAQKIAEEELLVVGPGQNSQLVNSSTRIRRLSIESTELESSSMGLPEWSNIAEKYKLLRSLIINGRVKFSPSTIESTLKCFPSLRALYVSHAETERFVETLCSLRHLRFLHLDSTDISRLPDDIGKLRFLQHIGLDKCRNFAGELPTSMLKLERLTSFIVDATKFIVPKGFGGLTGLRTLSRYPVQMDGDWCSLQELGTLSELTRLEIRGLAAVPSGALAAKGRISLKEQLIVLVLMCYNPPEDKISISDVVQEDCRRMEEVFDELCPPRLLESLVIKDYMGRRPPSWMCMTTGAIDFDSLMTLEMASLPFCMQLPDGLCRLPSLTCLFIDFALSIERVGPEFQQQTKTTTTSSSSSSSSGLRGPSFPSLQFLRFKVLPNWEEWEWAEEAEDEDSAMPKLQQLGIVGCQLSCLPTGLASSRRFALRELVLHDMPRMTSLENFPSVEELYVARCPRLRIIRGFAKTRGVRIEYCAALEVLEAGPELDIMYWMDPTADTLPDYLGGLKLNILRLYCHPKLVELLVSGNYRTEADKHPICNKILVTPCDTAGGSSTSTAS